MVTHLLWVASHLVFRNPAQDLETGARQWQDARATKTVLSENSWSVLGSL